MSEFSRLNRPSASSATNRIPRLLPSVGTFVNDCVPAALYACRTRSYHTEEGCGRHVSYEPMENEYGCRQPSTRSAETCCRLVQNADNNQHGCNCSNRSLRKEWARIGSLCAAFFRRYRRIHFFERAYYLDDGFIADIHSRYRSWRDDLATAGYFPGVFAANVGCCLHANAFLFAWCRYVCCGYKL